MSSSELYRNPTWISLFPQGPTSVAAAPELVKQLAPLLPEAGVLQQLEYGGRSSRHLLFEGASGDRLFLKIVPEHRTRSQENADRLAAWAAARGVSTIGPSAGFPRRLDDGSRLFAYPYHDCSPLGPGEADVGRLGEQLARLHQALADHPSRPDWRQATRTRLRHLLAIRTRLADGTLRAGPCPEPLTRLARDTRLDFVRADLPATCLHGDLNAGNLRRSSTSGLPLLLDFEDTFHSVLPAVFELGLVFERIVLVATDDDEEAASRLRALLESYRSAGGRLPPGPAVDFGRVVRSLSLRSLCVLTSCQLSGVEVDADEWRKFFRLAEAAARRPAAFEVDPPALRARSA